MGNELAPQVHQMADRIDGHARSLEALGGQLRELDKRQATDHLISTDGTEKYQVRLTALESRCQGLQDDFTAQVQKQQLSEEKLVNHSTQRYLEQIDRALGLQDKIDKVEGEHVRLHEHVRSIRLP